MRENVLLRISESSGGTFTDDEINRMIQREYENVQTLVNMKNDEYFAKQVTTNTVSTNVYAWPSDFLKLLMMELYYDNDEWWEVPKTSMHKVNEWEARRWWLRNSNPVRYYIIGSNYYLTPAQQNGTDNLRMTYLYTPTALSNDTDEPVIPDLYHEILEIGATNRLRKAVKEPPIDEDEYRMKLSNMVDTISPRVKHSPKQVRMVQGNY
jgi:hypothetical protein